MTNGKKFCLLIKQPCNSLGTLLNIGIKKKGQFVVRLKIVQEIMAWDGFL